MWWPFSNPERQINNLRKKYDRVREKVDKIKQRQKKIAILKLLDTVEPTLILLEEQNVVRFERNRMIRYVDNAIEQSKDLMKEEYAQKK